MGLLTRACHHALTVRSDGEKLVIWYLQRGGSVYLLTNTNHTVFYTGVTSDLLSRVTQHREKHYPTSFTSRYNIFKLVYFEVLPSVEEAIIREKQVKKYSRKKKFVLIEGMNPEWRDLYEDIKDW
jgi:putative endonuclease